MDPLQREREQRANALQLLIQKRQGRLQQKPKPVPEGPAAPTFCDDSDSEDDFSTTTNRTGANVSNRSYHSSSSRAPHAGVDGLLGRMQGLGLSSAVPAKPQVLSAPRAPEVATALDEEKDEQALSLDDGRYVLPGKIAATLYAHQRQGIQWLWSIYKVKKGGILGDDMGLGKTMQCSAFLAGAFHSKLLKRAVIVAPKTLLAHWEKELGICGLKHKVHSYYGTSEREREDSLRTIARRGGILLTTYGMVLHNADKLQDPTAGGRWGSMTDVGTDSDEFCWDAMVLDEGHKIKNPKMQLAIKLRQIPAVMRLIISGTPIQNNLMELHALYDFCCEGLLGDAREFKAKYERPITAGQDKAASTRQREEGARLAAELRSRTGPFFLRREKKDVLAPTTGAQAGELEGDSAAAAGTSAAAAGSGGAPKPQAMGRKNDLVVWLKLKPLQKHVYSAFLNSDTVKATLNTTKSPLAALTVLKKICDHPALVSKRAADHMVRSAARRQRRKEQQQGSSKGGAGKSSKRRDSLDDFIVDDDDDEYAEEESEDGSCSDDDFVQGVRKSSKQKPAGAGCDDDDQSWVEWDENSSVEEQLMAELQQRGADASCKTNFVMALLAELAAGGHRTLVFSQSRVMLDILEAELSAQSMDRCRIDGTMSAEERAAEVARFQSPRSSIPVFLLTSQVGGLGLTLTAADRVIIVDPSWNPAVDNQSVDRAYRIGQRRDVVVYRLMTCGTVEEKIYRRQVFKGGLSRTGIEQGLQFRYFSRTELREMFQVSPAGLEASETQALLSGLHGGQRVASEGLQQHLDFLEGLGGVAGISDHDLLFSVVPDDPDEVVQASKVQPKTLADVDWAASSGHSQRPAAPPPRTSHELQVAAAVRKLEELRKRQQRTSSSFQKLTISDGGEKMRQFAERQATEIATAEAELAALLDDTATSAMGAGTKAAGGRSSLPAFDAHLGDITNTKAGSELPAAAGKAGGKPTTPRMPVPSVDDLGEQLMSGLKLRGSKPQPPAAPVAMVDLSRSAPPSSQPAGAAKPSSAPAVVDLISPTGSPLATPAAQQQQQQQEEQPRSATSSGSRRFGHGLVKRSLGAADHSSSGQQEATSVPRPGGNRTSTAYELPNAYQQQEELEDEASFMSASSSAAASAGHSHQQPGHEASSPAAAAWEAARQLPLPASSPAQQAGSPGSGAGPAGGPEGEEAEQQRSSSSQQGPEQSAEQEEWADAEDGTAAGEEAAEQQLLQQQEPVAPADISHQQAEEEQQQQQQEEEAPAPTRAELKAEKAHLKDVLRNYEAAIAQAKQSGNALLAKQLKRERRELYDQYLLAKERLGEVS